jgi:hypothetical protein
MLMLLLLIYIMPWYLCSFGFLLHFFLAGDEEAWPDVT